MADDKTKTPVLKLHTPPTPAAPVVELSPRLKKRRVLMRIQRALESLPHADAAAVCAFVSQDYSHTPIEPPKAT